ncbi:MAG: PDR/VanB family oxidoreductase [Acidocella sp.]|nr:PDR/VanB family oxidoreductase [Acidocella sp.]
MTMRRCWRGGVLPMRYDESFAPATIAAIRDVAPAIRELTLHPAGNAVSYPTGAHLRVQVRINGKPGIRHYSLIGAPQDGVWRIAVKREDPGRGGSRFMWSLKPGDVVEISNPASHFELAANASAYLLIAGGIGITPILGMAQVLRRRAVPFRLLYAGRSEAETAYLPEVAQCGAQAEVYFADQGRFIDLASAFRALPLDGEAYICGPIGLLDAARAAWDAGGRPRARLRFETFGSSGRFAAEAFTVRLPRLNREVHVTAEMTMLDALEDAGIGVLADCRRGECGLCAMDVIASEREIDHRDVFFSDAQHAQNRKICACVSRVAGGTITLEPAWRGDVL